MGVILLVFKESFSKKSLSAFWISFLVLFIVEVLAYNFGKKLKSENSQNRIKSMNTRLIEVIVFSTGIAICFLGYWMIKDLNQDNQLLVTDILFPLITSFVGILMFWVIKTINVRLDYDTEDEQFIKNRKFLMLVTLIYFIVIGFISFSKIETKGQFMPNTGMLIFAVIIGRFLWFDTTCKSLVDDIRGFKPTLVYFVETAVIFMIISLIVFYFVSRTVKVLYGIYWGMQIEILFVIVWAIYSALYRKLKE